MEFECKHGLVSLGVAAALWLAPAWAQQQDVVEFACDVPASSTCYFSLMDSAGATRNFSLRGGEKDQVADVMPGKDQYCICVDAPAPMAFEHCQSGYQEKLCRQSVVQPGLNK